MSNYSYEDASVRQNQKGEVERLIDISSSAQHKLIAGGVAGELSCADIQVGDDLNEVIVYVFTDGAVTDVVDLTSEFSITGANKISNADGTSTAGNKVVVRWTKLTA